MKFIVSSAKLQKALSALSGVIPSNNTLPILNDFLFEAVDGKLRITTSDTETFMSIVVEPEMLDGDVNITIPASVFNTLLKSMSDVPLSVTIKEETLGIEISAGDGHYKMVGHKSDEYPRLQTLVDAKRWEIPADVIACGFEKTIYAASNDEVRPTMTGVLMEMTAERLTFVATDAHKLVRYRRTDVKSNEVAALIVPKKPVNQLKAMLASRADETVVVEFDRNNARFTFDDVCIQCRLIEGQYPKYDSVIPQSNNNVLLVDRASLVSAMRRVSIFASKATSQVRFRLKGQELTLSSEDLDYYNEAKERLTCNYTGEDMEIGFNARFFQEMLTNINTNEIQIALSTPERPGLITPSEVQNADEDILMLLMPVMLS